MPRVGQNPNRNLKAKQPQVVMSVITHLPNQFGYHEKRLEVIQLCIHTMRSRCGVDGALLYVWDNGSCNEFREWLKNEVKPDFLTLSPNIGKRAAQNAILRSFQPGTIISHSDDDMLFYQDWLKESIKLFDVSDKVGVVSCYPVRTQFYNGCKNTQKSLAALGAKLEVGKFMPDEWQADFAESVGRSPGYYLQSIADAVDVRGTWNGLQFYATGHHCQFTTVAGRLDNMLQWDQETMGPESAFENAIDAAGWMRLTTYQRLSRHIGNVADDRIRQEAK